MNDKGHTLWDNLSRAYRPRSRVLFMKKYSFFLSLLLLFSTATVHAQGFTGPRDDNNTQGQTVLVSRTVLISEARNLPHDSWVTLSGNIITMLPGGRQYTFRDSSGEITVDIGPKEWRRVTVNASDRVEISGEVKVQRGQVHIKVHTVAGAGETISGRYTTTISQARNLTHDSWVILTGNIVLALRGNNYTFRDSAPSFEGGGEITIDIGPKEWRGLTVGVADRVEISGEVKIGRGGEITIKVHAIRRI